MGACKITQTIRHNTSLHAEISIKKVLVLILFEVWKKSK